jgi:uncharacterized protein (TIRG00374 family)
LPSLSSWFRSLSPRARTALKFLFSAALSLLFLFLAFRGTDFSEIADALHNAEYGWMAGNLAVLMLSHVVRAWRWRYLLDPIKPNIGMRNLFSSVMVGYLMNGVLPRAGEVARPYALGKLESLSKGAAFGTIVVERIIDVCSFLLIILALPLLYDGPLRESFPWLERAGTTAVVVTGGLLVGLVVLMFRRDWTDRLLSVFSRLLPDRAGKTVVKVAHSFLDGFLFLKRPGTFLPIALLTVLIWSLYALMIYLAFFAFDLQDELGFKGAVVVLAISSIGVAIPTPGATGTYHVFASQTLIRLFFIDQAVALGFATVTHAVGLGGATLVGLYFLAKDHLSVSEVIEKTGEGSS